MKGYFSCDAGLELQCRLKPNTYSDTLLLLLADTCPGAVSGWTSVKAADGSTAADYAALVGAQDINKNMASEAAGDAVQSEAYGYLFNPETGELLDDEDEDSNMPTESTETVPPAAEEQQIMSAASTSSYLAPPVPGSKHELIEDAIEGTLRTQSEGFELEADKQSKAHDEFTGLHHRKKQNAFRSADDMYLYGKGHSLKPPPHVFDRPAAVLSSVAVGVVGCLALGLRYCLDYRGLEYWGT